MYHSIFPQVCTVVTKCSVTSDPTTNQSVYAAHSMFVQNASKKPPDPLGNVPLYDKVDPDQPVVVEPLLPRQSADGNDMWAQFKFPILPDSNKQAKVDEHAYDEIVDEHVYDKIGDNYLPPVEWREVSVRNEFIYI